MALSLKIAVIFFFFHLGITMSCCNLHNEAFQLIKTTWHFNLRTRNERVIATILTKLAAITLLAIVYCCYALVLLLQEF